MKQFLYWFLPFVVSIPFLFLRFDPLEFFFFDLRLRSHLSQKSSQKLALVIFDNVTVEKLGGIPSYFHHQKLIGEIGRANPKKIVYVAPLMRSFASPEESEATIAAPENSAGLVEFATAATAETRLIKLSSNMKLKGEAESLKLNVPLDGIKVVSAPPTSDSSSFAKDGVSRRVVLDYQGDILGHLQLARLALEEPNFFPRGSFIHYDTNQVWIDFIKSEAFSIYKFEDVISGVVDPTAFQSKIVLIGDDLKKNFSTYAASPLNHDPAALTATELHANMIDTLIRNSSPWSAPIWLNWLITSIVCGLTIQAVLSMKPARGIGMLFVTTLGLTFVGLVCFWTNSLMIAMLPAYLAIFICYYFFIPYRLILENRKSFEYFEKHRLLQQVEQLKTNFISMMSHDLKTPLARIQGMTEVIKNDEVSLSSRQQEALDHIGSSTNDLTRFVNSILNYARIESEGVVLHLESRDVNDLILEVIRRHEFHAKMKSISIHFEPEPLFPIKLDPELIKQVIGNLVENAIKYSSGHSKILVSTEEIGQEVLIQVSDQGEGISETELPHVFMKFFRSQNAKVSAVQGSGLGLYLAKYFIGLHQGRIQVESVPGQGSTFSVYLPIL